MKKRIFGIGCAAALLLGQFAAAEQVVFEENFDSYAAGGDITTATGMTWTVVSTATDATAKVDVDATGAGNAAVFEDLGAAGIRYGATSAALQAHNSGKGIEKGYIQYDLMALHTGAIWDVMTLRFYQEWPFLGSGDSWDNSKQLGYVHFNANGTGPLVVNLRGSGSNVPSPSNWVAGTEYRVKLTFDIPARTMGVTIYDGANLDNVWWQSATDVDIMALATAVPPFVGVKGVGFDSPANVGRNPKYQVDNLKFVDSTVTADAPEIKVEDGTTEILDGATTPISIGNADVAATPPSKTFTVTNTGNQELTLGTPSVPANYTITEPLAASLAASASDTFTVEVGTATGGIYAGEISIVTNDADENPFNFAVTSNIGSTEVEDWNER